MIRSASFLDIPAIINLGNRYVEDEVKAVGHHSATWDAVESAHHLAMALTSDDLFLWVATHDGEVVGFLWGGAHPLAPWSPVTVASDYLFYLVPEHRGTIKGLRLVKAFKEWATDKGCQEVRDRKSVV